MLKSYNYKKRSIDWVTPKDIIKAYEYSKKNPKADSLFEALGHIRADFQETTPDIYKYLTIRFSTTISMVSFKI